MDGLVKPEVEFGNTNKTRSKSDSNLSHLEFESRQKSLSNPSSSIGGGNNGTRERKSSPHLFSILPPDNNIVQAVILSEWDNIVGPKAKFIWTQERPSTSTASNGENDNINCGINVVTTNVDGPNVDGPRVHQHNARFRLPSSQIQTAIKYSAKHTLHGELRNDYRSGQIYDKLFVVSDQGFVVVAAIFSSTCVDIDEEDHESSVPHSLSVVVPYDELDYYLSIHPFCLDWMHCTVSRSRVLLHKAEEMLVLATLTNNITDFCSVLQSLQYQAVISPNLPSKRIGLCLNDIEKFPVKFLEFAITSHLQTNGCSVVIGSDPREVNLLVETLTLLLDKQEQKCCRRAGVDRIPMAYTPGLLVQGLLKDEFGDANISSHDLMCSRFPTTLVDVNLRTVRQSSLYHDHLIQRKKSLKNEIYNLWKGMRVQSDQFDLKSLFTVVDEPSSLVKTFLHEMVSFTWDDNKRMLLVSQFRRQLEYRAFTLIKCCEKLQTGRNFPNRFTCKILAQMIALEDEDFKIVLAVAEKLKPGLYTALTSTNLFNDI